MRNMIEAYEKTYTQHKWDETATPMNPAYSVQLCWRLSWEAANCSKAADRIVELENQLNKLLDAINFIRNSEHLSGSQISASWAALDKIIAEIEASK